MGRGTMVPFSATIDGRYWPQVVVEQSGDIGSIGRTAADSQRLETLATTDQPIPGFKPHEARIRESPRKLTINRVRTIERIDQRH